MGSARLPQQALLESYIIENGFQLQANNDQSSNNLLPNRIIDQE